MSERTGATPRPGGLLALLLSMAVCLSCADGRGDSAESLVRSGEERFNEGDYPAARTLWRQALERGGVGTPLEPRILAWMAWADLTEGDYEPARTLAERALALERALGSEGDPFTLNLLGVIPWYEGRLAEAEQWLELARDAADASGDPSMVARIGNNLGLVLNEYGEYGRARAAFASVRDAGRELGIPRYEAAGHSNLGMVDVWAGDPAAAVESLLEARSLYAALDFPADEQNTLGQLGTAYLALGEFQSAFLALDSALTISRRHGLRQEEASNLEWLAQLYREMGDTQRALQLLSRALEIDLELGLDVESGSVLARQAGILSGLGHHESAREKALEALALHRASGARYDELLDLLFLAEIAHATGAGATSADLLEQARVLAHQLDARGARLRSALTAARLADRAGRSEEALRFAEALESELSAPELAALWEVPALRARSLRRLGRVDDAIVAGEAAVAALEAVRAGLGSPELQTVYVADRREVFGDLTLALLGAGRMRDAFEVADRARGRALIEHLGAARDERPGEDLVDQLAEGDALLRKIDRLMSSLASLDRVPTEQRSGIDEANSRDLSDRLAEARSAYEAFLVRIAGWESGGPEILAARPAPAASVMAVLAPDEALLEYLLLSDRLLIFVASKGGVRVVESAVDETDLTSRVLFARDLLAKPRARLAESRALAEGLHELLFAPAIRSGVLDTADRLIIVPHGVLTYLPFSALRDPATGHTMADDFVLSQVPSASALAALRTRDRVTAAPLPLSVFAPFPDRLPATAREARSVGSTTELSVVREGGRATEAELREALAESGIVHVATHGVLNPVNPMFSRIELSRGRSSQGTADDGRLEVHELLRMEVSRSLVFLSGCETALGAAWSPDFAQGEDYATLARAFLYAGAQNIVATLWRIEDDGAAAFAERFYAHLQTSDPAAALARAQRDLRDDPRWSSPYYWAGYVIIGDGG